MNTFAAARLLGVTLVELMIGIAVLGILLGLAMPNFQIWLQNVQIRTAAEAIQNGLQLARGEAVKRNTNVSFVLSTNSAWVVSVVGGGVIESRPGTEGSKNVTLTVLPAGATTITFNSFGGIGVNADASAPLTQINIDSPLLAAAASRDLRVTIGLGGNVRLCDPNAPVSSPTAC